MGFTLQQEQQLYDFGKIAQGAEDMIETFRRLDAAIDQLEADCAPLRTEWGEMNQSAGIAYDHADKLLRLGLHKLGEFINSCHVATVDVNEVAQRTNAAVGASFSDGK